MSGKVRRVRRKRRVKNPRAATRLSPRQIAILVLATLVGMAIGTTCLLYGPRAYNGWRESRLLQRANALLQKDDLAGATLAAQEALKVQPSSLPAYYVLAEATEKQNRAETVSWRAQIAHLLPHVLESHLNLASAALRFSQLDIARRALEGVEPADRDKAAYHVVAGWLARAEGNDAEVDKQFAAAVKQEPANDLYQFNLAVLQIHSPDDAISAAARETLQRLASVSRYHTGSVRALLTDAIEQEDLEAADRLVQDLQMSQQVTFSDYLLCLDFYRKLDQKKLAALLEKVKPVAARDAGDLALLMEWMNRNGLAGDILRWMEKLPKELTTNPPAAVAIAAAFVEVKNWSRLKRWTRTGAWGDSDFLRLAYQAYATRQSRQSVADVEFDSLWSAADDAAAEQPERIVVLARLATKWGFASEAEQLWQRVAKHAPMRREALLALNQIYRASNDLPNLYKTARRLHEVSPRDAEMTANFARLALLLEQNAGEGHRFAKEAYEGAPESPNCAVTYAFSLYGLARTPEAVEVLQKLPAEALHEPHAAAYVALILSDENQLEPAKDLVAAAQKGQVFPEEKKLLDEAVQKIERAEALAAATPSIPAPEMPDPSPTETPATPTPSP